MIKIVRAKKIPVFRKKADFQPPKDTLVYDLRASNGTFRIRQTMSYIACHRIKPRGFKRYLPHEGYAKLFLPKIPWEQFLQILNFFKWASFEHDSEGMIFMYFNPETGKYFFDAPIQTVSGADVDWRGQPSPDGYYRVGDVHSHNNGPAWHSGIDDDDEKDMNSIHITVGNVREMPSVSLSLVVDGYRFKFNALDLIDFPQGPKPPQEWLSRVRKFKPRKTGKVAVGA